MICVGRSSGLVSDFASSKEYVGKLVSQVQEKKTLGAGSRPAHSRGTRGKAEDPSMLGLKEVVQEGSGIQC